MRKLVIFLVVLVILLGIGEFFATNLAEEEIEQRIGKKVGARTQAEIDSFPLVTRTLLTEEIDRLTVTLTDVDYEEIHFDTLRIEASGIEVPRARLLDRKLRPKRIDSGTVSAFISTTSLEEATGIAIPALDPGNVSARLDGGTLTLEVSGVPPFNVSVPQEALPCSATGRVVENGVRLACNVDGIPDIVLQNIPD
ncbi:MAG: DUF2993 domain-containing protein [Actinomycetota bacterium]|nr:DUF2993 domain-containing protein [Actinomycetota bacterium]